ncbi:UDP-2,4-diacetamido-2,4,6-trideoxy-beta-L-altropyranose hydrolase [mine drainage metagenome]|uniref:UDP-2,4-diacetamido-2,4, 6-trideoxy-beta-L-altropyranose hydrolase n=1 Tax=mine drainage metagenome TaxID=410659 RepID=A0A1J5QXB6_9ZZZZ
MKVAFRVDASATIGSGHLMRCLALADKLQEHGDVILFVVRAAEQTWQALPRQYHLAVVTLPESAADWARDAEETRAALAIFGSPDWLVIDHYGLGSEWEAAMRDFCGRIFVIDDIGRHHDCDLLLDQNVLNNPESYRDRVPAHCRRLLGPGYALLRREFREARARLRHRDGSVRRVLISFGGSDPTGETEKAIEGFLAAGLDGVMADVVLGPANPRAAEIKQKFGTHPRVHLIPHTDHMAAEMLGADLAISAGGVSMWERACLGLPSIVITAADNQMKGAEWLAAQGGHLLLGESAVVAAQDIAEALCCLAGNSQLRTLFARTGAALVDGCGSERVAHRLLGGRIILRRVTTADCDMIYIWRNAEVNRRYSGDERPFHIEAHRQWFACMTADPSQIMLIGEADIGPVGVLRFDLDDTEAVVSIYLVPGQHGMGWGEALLDSGAVWLRTHLPEITTVHARVKSGNQASLAVFGRAGYVEQDRTLILSLHNRNTP